jgi:glycosyltransferase involved in cell wall biosynthesis
VKKASLIICTHNPREDYLRRVLEGLRVQTLPVDEWEFLLIDNGSSSPLAALYDISWHPQGRHVREDRLGLTNARVRGIEESTAGLIVFADDDTVLAPDYLEQALVVEKEWPFIGAWGGRLVPEFEVPLPEWIPNPSNLFSIYDLRTDMWSNLREDTTTYPLGAGLCVRRAVAEAYVKKWRAKPEMASLGRKGKDLGGFEDLEISGCAIDMGLGAGKSTRLNLTHLIRASRMTPDYFIRYGEDEGSSYQMYRALRGLPIEKPKPLGWIGRLRWWVHRVKNRVPREVYLNQLAMRRGATRGYEAAAQYLQAFPPPPKPPPEPWARNRTSWR